MTLGLIDIESGNLKSLESAIIKSNIKYKICRKQEDFQGVTKIILPGVGAFPDFMDRLKKKNLLKKIIEKCHNQVPFLGICAGYQIIFKESYEHGYHGGLGLIDGSFKKFNNKFDKIKVPHVGWNNCNIIKKSPLFDGIKNNSDFYFDHSYFLETYNEATVTTTTEYHFDFVSSINFKNIYGVQFHPEKSQENGLRCLKNFSEIC